MHTRYPVEAVLWSFQLNLIYPWLQKGPEDTRMSVDPLGYVRRWLTGAPLVKRPVAQASGG